VGRYRGLRGGQAITLGMVARPVGHEADRCAAPTPDPLADPCRDAAHALPRTVTLDPIRVGRDASRVADEVIAHLSGLVGAKVKATLEVEAKIPSGAPDRVVRTVTENSRTLKFTSLGFVQSAAFGQSFQNPLKRSAANSV